MEAARESRASWVWLSLLHGRGDSGKMSEVAGSKLGEDQVLGRQMDFVTFWFQDGVSQTYQLRY